jgi:3-methylfumaryl-CoA hydratase
MTDSHQPLGTFDEWIGRTKQAHDEITSFPIRALAGMLERDGIDASRGGPVPPLWHWLYFLPVYPPRETRADGHAKGDDFMPPIPLPRRVWAGSNFTWTAGNPLRVGDVVRRTSRIDAITPKSGKGGQLIFVKTVHEFHNEAGLALVNEQLNAFREDATEAGSTRTPVPAETQAPWHRRVVPDSVQLFRYAALTFNSHRIHYDSPYTTGRERYPGLLVQGPLIATLLMDLLSRHSPHAAVRRLEFKAVRPSFVDRPMHLRGQPEGSAVRLWAADDEGNLAMSALAEIND